MAKIEITQKVFVEKAIEMMTEAGLDEKYIEKGKAMLTQLEKKKSGSGKSKAEIERDNKLAEKVLEALATVDEVQTLTDLTTIVEKPEGIKVLSTQKLNPIVKNLVAEGKVNMTVVSKRNYYALA